MEELYFAYGSNLNLGQMAVRCPQAGGVGKAVLEGYELAFRRGVLTILPKEGGRVNGLLWRVNAWDELTLDRYEGYPHLYTKELLPVQTDSGPQTVVAYVTKAAASATDLYYPRAWAYAREAKDTPALPQQLADLCAAARLEGYCMVGQSCDSTRRSMIRRPGCRALLRAVRNGQVDDVFVTRLTQLSSKRGRLRRILALFQRKGVRVHTTEIDLRYDLYRHGLDGVLL